MNPKNIADNLEVWCNCLVSSFGDHYVIKLSGSNDNLIIGEGNTMEEARKCAILVLKGLLKDTEKVDY